MLPPALFKSRIFSVSALAVLLILGPEFFFVQDVFGNRMNTVFKFYFQGWTLWSIAAAFGTVILLGPSRRRAVVAALLTVAAAATALVRATTCPT